jgi:quercetin dioxygenase-like cupin family protein
VVHGFRNARDAEVRYLNLHAPGQGFAAYLRAMRDGRPDPFDQAPPPPDGGRPSSEAAIEGEGPPCDLPGARVTVLADVPEIAVAETRQEPGGPPPPPHRHDGRVECLYVLEGELALKAGDRELSAPAGAWVQVPPGVAHSDPVAVGGPARFLTLQAPGGGFDWPAVRL